MSSELDRPGASGNDRPSQSDRPSETSESASPESRPVPRYDAENTVSRLESFVRRDEQQARGVVEDQGFRPEDLAALENDGVPRPGDPGHVPVPDRGRPVAAPDTGKETLRERELGDEGVLMHAHSEFRGEKLDLYTDGTHWRSGEALEEAQKKNPDTGRQGISDVPGMREQGIDVIGDKPPDDESELPPSAEGLLEADEGESKLDRLRNKAVRNLSDAVDASSNQADAIRNILNTPPTARAEVMARPELGPVADASPHAGPTVDAVTELAVVTLLVGYQVSGWTRRKVDEIRGRHDGSPG